MTPPSISEPPTPGAEHGGSRRLLILLSAGNVSAWLWALSAFRGDPVLLGTALLAYLLGLRHALDADHIAAIDNVTRKLMQQGRNPHAVGLYFSLGHSTVLILTCAAIALMSASVAAWLSELSDFRAMGTAVSAGFLLLIAAANVGPLVSVHRAFRAERVSTPPAPQEEAVMPGGLLVRLLGPLLEVISSPWRMYPLGLLFGLSFDTATAVGLLVIAAQQASHVSPWSIMVFPALFTGGMALVDTADAVLMARAYGWAFDRPRRKLAYNLVMTLASIATAVMVGCLQTLDLLSARFAMSGGVWRWIGSANDHFAAIGAAIVVAFIGIWGISLLLNRPRAPTARQLRQAMAATTPPRRRSACEACGEGWRRGP